LQGDQGHVGLLSQVVLGHGFIKLVAALFAQHGDNFAEIGFAHGLAPYFDSYLKTKNYPHIVPVRGNKRR
jgi:hypothetical protein